MSAGHMTKFCIIHLQKVRPHDPFEEKSQNLVYRFYSSQETTLPLGPLKSNSNIAVAKKKIPLRMTEQSESLSEMWFALITPPAVCGQDDSDDETVCTKRTQQRKRHRNLDSANSCVESLIEFSCEEGEETVSSEVKCGFVSCWSFPVYDICVKCLTMVYVVI